MNSLIDVPARQLFKAAQVKEKIENLEHELRITLDLNGHHAPSARVISTPAAQERPFRRRRMSPAAKARLSVIAKRRWKKAFAAGKSSL